MHAYRLLTLRIDKNVNCVLGVRMHRTPHPAGLVGADGDETEIKWPAESADLCEGGADGKVGERRGIVVVGVVWIWGDGGAERGWDGAVAGVTANMLELR